MSETKLTTPLGRARWILSTDERGTQAEVDVLDALVARVQELEQEVARLQSVIAWEEGSP